MMIPPRLKKMDKQVIHDHLEKLADDLRKRGAAHVSVGDWSHGRVGINVYWGRNVDPRRPSDTCERYDWLCVGWFPKDGAWRIYGPGVPLRTGRCLTHAIGERRWRFRQLEQVLGLWARFRSSRSERRWQEYLGGLHAALRSDQGGQP